ncbi:MAG: tetratricopeptide repeat protein [Victivallaceae bacterium]|nr:tetratricopeptide repeat protein [Victivallaceae bacterium]
MKPKELKDVSSSQRELYKKAVQSGQRKNTDYAIKQLLMLVKATPELIPVREELRKQERIKSDNIGGIGKLMAKIKPLLTVAKIKATIAKKPREAMKLCEECLAAFLYNPLILGLLADAALNAKAPFIAIESRKLSREIDPDNETNLRKLADVYKKLDQPNEVVQIFQKISSMHPTNVGIQSELRSAVALASMQEGQWESEGDYKTRLKDKEEAVSLEREDNIIRDEEHIDDMIARYKQELAENNSTDTRKRLAALYLQGKQYDEAIETYQQVVEQVGHLDPAIDKQIESAFIAKCNSIIGQIQADPSCIDQPEEQLTAWTKERDDYRLERATERANNFPNDNQLQYDLAVVNFDLNMLDDAIEHFQRASKNPQRKLSSNIFLGRCFAAKEHLDMAIEQFEEALGQQSTMNKQKKETLYYLAEAYEKTGNKEKAKEYFKDIYQNDINYRDVADKVQQYYNNG